MCNCIASDCIPMFLENGFLTENILDKYNTQEGFESEIQRLASDEQYRLRVLGEAKEILFSNHTYHHRLSEVMKAVKKDDEAISILKRLEHYK